MGLSNWMIGAIALNALYVALMSSAVSYLKADAKNNAWRWLQALTLWWPMNDDLYENAPRVRRFRLVGLVVAMATIAAYVLAFRQMSDVSN